MKELVLESKVVWHPKVKEWCGLPYYDKKNGCPNFNVRDGCPMNNKNIDEIINIDKNVFIVGFIFDLEEHREKMRKKHPKWSYRQLNSILYWQPHLVKELNNLVNKFLWSHIGLIAVYKPEGFGVNLTRMLRNCGMPISWEYPLKKIFYMTLVGEPV